MRKIITASLMLLISLTLAGCGAGKVQFNETYLPGAAPDQPLAKIALDSTVRDDLAQYQRQAKLANNIELCWPAADTLYLHLEKAAVYAVHPVAASVTRLGDDERKAALAEINKKITITNTAAGGGLLKKATSYLFSTFGQQYTGEMIDGGNPYPLEVKLEMTRGADTSETSCASVKLKIQLTDSKGKQMHLEEPYPCDWSAQPIANDKVPQILRQLYASPSGKYLLNANQLYRFGAQKPLADLFSGYPGVVSVAVKPDWTQIAVLRQSRDAYGIEFFNLKNLD